MAADKTTWVDLGPAGMASTRHLALAAGLLALCAIGVGILIYGGHLTIPRPQRAALRGVRAAVHGELERLENVVPGGRTPDDGLWRAYLDLVAKELEHGHVDVAVRVWQDAYGAALASGSWESMIAVGDAFVAIGRASGSVGGARILGRGRLYPFERELLRAVAALERYLTDGPTAPTE